MRRLSLAVWYFKDLFNPVNTIPPDTKKVRLGEENTITAAEVFPTVKSLKAGKAAGCNEIRPEILKVLIQVFLLARMCQVAWCSRREPKDW